MSTSISVNKQSVLELLKTGVAKPFVIPEYQRPYAWSNEEAETLFDDIWEFATTIGGLKRDGSYFLGCIVSFDNHGEQEVIDGQQRITSLFLLLRAIYTKLIKSEDADTDAAKNFIRQIEPAIWRTDKLTGKVDYSDILLTSRVVDNEGNSILRNILETGATDSAAEDNYSTNYRLFQRLLDSHSEASPLNVYDFIYALLNQAILLPIGADSQDTALTIFSTLNNRGLPLSDADIFKAKIYNNLSGKEQDAFIEAWKKLDKEAREAKESIQQLFYYYMFFLRALDNDVSSTTPGLRKYYSANKSSKLLAPNLMDNLNIVLNLWKVINTHQDIPEETWCNDSEISKALDILTSYPNEFWKYPVIIYYLVHRKESNFNVEFLIFLHKLIAELMSRFILMPTINAVKTDIMKLNAKIVTSSHPVFDFKPMDDKLLDERITIPHRNIVRMLLKTFAYQHQTKLLPVDWQIEHILPQRWQSSFFPNNTDEEVNEKVEHIGNKTPFERKLNIIASNGYFSKKKAEYSKSEIEVTKILTLSTVSDWSLSNIVARDEVVKHDIQTVINKWNNEYA